MTTKIKSFDELKSIQERLKAGRDPKKPCITICVGTGCLAYGTQKLVDNFREELAKRNLTEKIDFRTTGCHGFCERGPMVVIAPEKVFSGEMTTIGPRSQNPWQPLVRKSILLVRSRLASSSRKLSTSF